MRKRLAALTNAELVVHYNTLEDALRAESVTQVVQRRHDEIDAAREEMRVRGIR